MKSSAASGPVPARTTSNGASHSNQKSAVKTVANTKQKATVNASTPEPVQVAAKDSARRASISTGSSSAIGKRPADTNPSMSLSTLPRVSRKTTVASPQSPDRADSAELSDSGIVASTEERPPKWYKEQARSTSRNPDEANVLTLLQRLNTAIGKHDIDNVRDILHKLPFEQVNQSLLKGTRMLNNDAGLCLLFDTRNGCQPWPYDISADASELYAKWARRVFEVDLLRGIQLQSKATKRDGGDRNNDRIIPGYAGKVDFRAWGNNGLSNGQWFPTQLTTVRDGAHGATQGGISGKLGEGAYSCIVTGHQSGYPDEDYGDVIKYCGTDSTNGTITDRTQMLIDSLNNEKPVRLIRKYTVGTPLAPEVGYRYDGLYAVESFEKLIVSDNPKAQRHRFRMVRCGGQDPIRGGGPEARPTEQEIARYRADKHFR